MRRCLVVDDSSVIRKVARSLFELCAFDVDEAEGGREALTSCRNAPPDLILLDWHMPAMGAIEFLSVLRGMPMSKRPFVLYCTTEADNEDISRAFDAGADDFIIKPFDRAALESKLAEMPHFG